MEYIQEKKSFQSFESGGGFAPFEPLPKPETSILPSFPVENLPLPLRDMAIAAANNLQVSVDMTASAGLTITSLCLQRKFVIHPKPGWIETLSLFTAIIARSSERKTPTLSTMMQPVYDYEQEENDRRRPLVEEYQMKRDILTKKIDALKDMAAKPILTKGKEVDLNAITELKYQLADVEREAVKPLRLLADDITQEALVSLMQANDGKIAIVSDEGGIYDIIAGRYSGSKVNLDVFLNGYSGKRPLQIDRKGRSSERVENPALTMLLMVQPTVLETIMSNRELAGRGFLARTLYSLPESFAGHRVYETPPIPQEVETAYKNLIYALLSIPDLGEARVLKISPEAHQEATQFFNSLEPRLMPDVGDLEDIEEWAGKYHGQIMRIAALIHCCLYLEDSAQVPVSVSTMKAAQNIGEYFLAHAKAAFQGMGLTESQEVKDARYILRRLKKAKEQGKINQGTIDKHDLIRLCQKLKTAEKMEPGLSELVRRGYIRIETIQTGKRGNPRQIVYLNPNAE